MSVQDGKQTAVEQYPVNNGMITWQDFWKQLGQPWRTEPMIDADRQKYLAERRSFIPDLDKALYPLGGIKLSRADVEWLLATHENGCGPVDWSDESQRNRKGLDLRGADLRGVDLSGLPLACLLGGDLMEFGPKTDAQIEAGAIHLEGANLFLTHLEGAKLRNAHLDEANLLDTYLEEAVLFDVHLERARLITAHLERAMCFNAHLERADLSGANLEGAGLSCSNLTDTNLGNTNLRRTNLYQVHLEKADLTGAKLDGAA